MNLTGPALLDAINYLPCIRSRQAELKGYSELRQTTKDALHPIVALGKLGRAYHSEKVLEQVIAKVGPCFLDLHSAPGQTCEDWDQLCDHSDNYKAWRDLAASVAGITPVALLREGATERPFIRQVLSIENDFGAVVIRSRQPAQDLAALQAALSAVNEVNNLLIVLDFGYVRGALEPKAIEARRVISALRTTDPTARIAVVGSSYPRSVAVYGDRRHMLEILERDLHAQLGGDEVAIYGDHSSIFPEHFEPTMSRWVPRIDYCLDAAWLYERRREDEGGYVECARSIVASTDWDAEFATQAWGAGKILEAADTEVVPVGFGAPSNWIAARVNMHIERQSALSTAVLRAGGDDDDDFDELLG